MSQSEHSLCKAILEQGINKGKQCDRPILKSGFCGKHQKQSVLDTDINGGKRKCSKYRCTETFIPKTDKNLEYCEKCTKTKEAKLETLTLCKWTKLKCDKQAKGSGFCGKHEPRGLLIQEAEKNGIRICDDGKRGCKNQTVDKKLRCEECLEKERIKDNNRYNERKDDLSKCLGCGKGISELIDGIRGDRVQRCSECYEKLRKTEEEREPRNRNYMVEKKANMERYLISYIQCAKIRNIGFEITKQQFETIVLMPCYYCGSYNKEEVVGIDRLNSSKNYTIDNCVPCCKTCNFMKGTLSKNIFIQQAHKISLQHPIEGISKDEAVPVNTLLSSTMQPLKVAELYRHNKFDQYIEACIRDKRSPLFIERLKSIKDKKFTYREFIDFFRTCCKADYKLCSIQSLSDRKRISQKEVYGYFNNKNCKDMIEIYQSIHGKMPGFKEDMEEIAKNWDTITFDERVIQINSVIVKYRNQRANGTVKSE
jgi:hypothetical protein